MSRRLRKSRKAIRKGVLHLALAAVSVGGAGFARAQTKPDATATTMTATSAAMSPNAAPVTAPATASAPAMSAWNAKANDGRFQDSIDAFVTADREHAPAQGGVLFIGSSTIRFWENLGEQFKNLPIIRRGFGGSRMADCTHYVDALVTPHKPKMVVVYAGDNDINEGATPQDVLQSFTTFTTEIRKKLPNTRIAYVSIKPSPSRAKNLIPSLETNALIKKYTRSMPNMDYIDTYSPMLDAKGEPRHELFRADELHMNSKGYDLWQKIIGPHMKQSMISGGTPQVATSK